MISLRNLTEFKGVIVKIVQEFGMRPRFRQFCKPSEVELDVIESQIADREVKMMEEKLQQLRNKSGLTPAHFNIQHDKVPYDEVEINSPSRPGFKRKMYGLYGSSSRVNPSILWPNTKELELAKEYEAVGHPQTLVELIESVKKQDRQQEEIKRKREEEVLAKVKVNKERIKAFKERVRNKYLQALEAKKKKEKLVADIRMKLGYNIDQKHEKFREEVAKLDEIQRRKAKEEKKAAKEAKKSNLGKSKGVSQEANEESSADAK